MTPLKKKIFIKQFFSTLIFWLVLLGLIFGYVCHVEYGKAINNLKEKEKLNITLGQHAIKDQLLERVSDILILSKLLRLKSHHIEDESFNHIIEELKLFSEEKGCYDQVRVIDNLGYEVIRLNLENGRVVSVPKDRLQYKMHRYYLKESNMLFNDEVYISPLDLNVEHGVIEKPIKPMIRIAINVFDENNKKVGVLVLNYLAQILLDRIYRSIPKQQERVSLLNSDGYWLMGKQKDKNWGFMFGNDERYQKYHPQAWERIALEDKGQFETEAGMFTFSSVYPVTESLREKNTIKLITSQAGVLETGYVWKLVSFVPKAELGRMQEEIREKFYYVTFVLLIVLMLVNWRLAVYRTKNRLAEIALQRSYQRLEHKVKERTRALQQEVEIRKKAEESMRHMASYDALTEIPNRALLLENLVSVMAMNKRYQTRSALLFVDLDGFKGVNDDYGHEVGDFLLKQVSRRLGKAVRKSDMVGRYGGDEFVVLLAKINANEDAEAVAKQIVEIISEPYQIFELEVHISCSIGLAFYKETYQDPKQYIKAADMAMYQIKKSGKNHYKLAES